MAHNEPTLRVERENFVSGRGIELAQTVCPTAEPWTAITRVPSFFAWLADAEHLVVVGRAGERPADLDLGLAYGLAHMGDRELSIVLPEGSAEPTRRRLPWLDLPIRVFTYRSSGGATALPPMARTQVLDSYKDALVTESHQLGDRSAWVDRLVRWADTCPELVPAHRRSYLAWHSRGRKVLAIKRNRGGLIATAGVHYTKGPNRPHSEPVDSPMSPAAFHRLTSAASSAVADRLTGTDTANAEHQLQERVAAERLRLGLKVALREFPAMRPVDQRGFIDFLGVSRDGSLRVVETKIGPDPMLVLQGLDYWVWAMAHRAELVVHLNNEAEVDLAPDCEVKLDFIVGAKAGKTLSLITAAQAEALDGSIGWQFHTVAGWDGETLEIATLPRRQLPAAPRAIDPKFAVSLEQNLIAGAGPAIHRRVFFAEKGGGILAAAKPAYDYLAEQGLLHGFVDHVRSSQAFAINLFGGLNPDRVSVLYSLIDPDVVTHDEIEFEYSDPHDELAESQPHRPHRTQVDVVLRGTTADGRRHVALIEVKLSESAFGACSAFEAPENDTRALCANNEPWGGDPAGCFQLRNRGHEPRRRYDHFIDPEWAETTSQAGCEFLELNQPMRNVALGRVLIDRGEADTVAVCLCAPRENRTVWRQWARVHKAFKAVPALTVVDLPADLVVQVRGAEEADVLAQRYHLGGS